MIEVLVSLYPWIKTLHVVSVISWMAGLLYLPRLFVYHAESAPFSEASERFKIQERRLLRAIMNPAMIAVWVTGGTMASNAFRLMAVGVTANSSLASLKLRWRAAASKARSEFRGGNR